MPLLTNDIAALAAIEHIHRNPVRRGLVQRATDWQWSSARWYAALPSDVRIRVPKLGKLPAEFSMETAR
jgi:putative transposase